MGNSIAHMAQAVETNLPKSLPTQVGVPTVP